MHPPINVLVNFNDFIKKNIKLQNIKLEGLLKHVIPIIPISKNFHLRFPTYSYKSLKLVNRDLKSSWFGQGIPQKTSSLESYSNCGGSYCNDDVEPFNFLISSNKENMNQHDFLPTKE
jgi:hypothetical protein